MRVLWFTNTPSLYQKNRHNYNGCGWIESLETYIRNIPGIELGIAFFHNDTVFKSVNERVVYYSIPLNKPWLKIWYRINPKIRDVKHIDAFRKVIDDFKPDIIHVFGSENSFGCIQQYSTIPVVLHLQGVLNPCLNAWFPPGYSLRDMACLLRYNPLRIASYTDSYKMFALHAKREREMLRFIKHYMGRTTWDKQVLSILAPEASYYHCDEILRPPFYNSQKWQPPMNNGRVKLVTTISSPLYKGFDVVLKTAAILSDTSLDFEWHVFGNVDKKISEQKLKIKVENVHIKMRGVVSAEELVRELSDASAFIHTSYIDNSSNSVCEAQIIGVPVIATFVGGIPSLIEHSTTGILVPANDPYALSASILQLVRNPQRALEISKNGCQVAKKRHDPTGIIAKLINIYHHILKQ